MKIKRPAGENFRHLSRAGAKPRWPRPLPLAAESTDISFRIRAFPGGARGLFLGLDDLSFLLGTWTNKDPAKWSRSRFNFPPKMKPDCPHHGGQAGRSYSSVPNVTYLNAAIKESGDPD